MGGNGCHCGRPRGNGLRPVAFARQFYSLTRRGAHGALSASAGIAPATQRGLGRRLAVVARYAQRLQVGPIEARTAILDRHHVVDHNGRDGHPSCPARDTHRVRAQIRRATLLPGHRLVEAELRIERAPGATVIAMRPSTMCGAEAGRREHSRASWEAARRRRSTWHQIFRLAS